MSALQTIKTLKEENQDFEWYPTTREIIEAMYWDINGEKLGEETFQASKKRVSILDAGAGNGKLLSVFKEIAQEQPLLSENFIDRDGEERYRYEEYRYVNQVYIDKYMVIEKSQKLVELMPKETIVVGMDFHENTLIDKQADIVFCNPPYSEYEKWTTRIIRESNAKTIYLVIPQRWGKHKGIAQALKDRKAKVKILGNFDFLNAEDRKARAYVSLVKIDLTYKKHRNNGYYHKEPEQRVDPFDLWFNQNFKKVENETDKFSADYEKAQVKAQKFQQKIENELVAGRDLVSVLVELYDKELQKLIDTYMKLSELDSELFAELGIQIATVKESFRSKINGLKHLYWEEIFNNLTEITKRLTRSTRDKLKEKLMSESAIDFNEANIRAVVLWVVKNANHYYEEQMLEFYDAFTTEEGIKLYKSNQHFAKDDFRYNKRDGNLSKYALDYRIILHYYVDDWDKREGRVSEKQYDNIRDAGVIGRNLGFEVQDSIYETATKYNGKLQYGVKENIFFKVSKKLLKKGDKTLDGKIEEVYIHTNKPNKNGERVMEKDGVLYVFDKSNKSDWIQYKINGQYYHGDFVYTEQNIFTTVKPYKNGNCHFQFNKKFIQKLNLEVGRIRGWLKDPKHASEEMDISIEDATEYWKSSFILLPENIHKMLPNMSLNLSTEDEDKGVVLEDQYGSAEKECFSNGTLF